MDANKSTKESDYTALNNFVVNCPQLAELEASLGNFNLFQVLGVEHAELKHSNMLAWLLDPQEGHGFDDLFLQRWLMRTLHSAEASIPGVTPVTIDGWQLTNVEVRREWQNIDLLLILSFTDGKQWMVCVENKVNAPQSDGQLLKYRTVVEAEFPKADKRIYLFLTKNKEIPADDAYLPASYDDVHAALSETLEMRRHSIGGEPRVLIENYKRLLEEKFMENSEVANMALTIYKNHKRAIDVIIANRPGSGGQTHLSELAACLEENRKSLGIQMGRVDKSYVRFVPLAWDVEANWQGKGWKDSKFTVVFEIDISKQGARFLIVAGKPPEGWLNGFTEEMQRIRAESDTRDRGGKTFPRIFGEMIPTEIYDPGEVYGPGEAGQILYEWIKNRLQDKEIKKVIEVVAAEVMKLSEFE